MDNKLHRGYFEEYLKDVTDEFSMYPTARIWNSIYNNIHPNKKLPSIVTSILIILALGFLGNNNTIQPNKPATANNTEMVDSKILLTKNQDFSINNNSILKISPQLSVVHSKAISSNTFEGRSESTKDANTLYSSNNLLPTEKNNQYPLQHSPINNVVSPQILLRINSIEKEAIQHPIAQYKQELNRRGSISYQLYTTPSLEYRFPLAAEQTTELLSESSASMLKNSNSQDNNLINKEPSLNIEAGGALLIKVSDAVRIKAGMQLNYAKFKNSSIQSTASPIIGSFSNINDPINNHSFNNTRYQISLPIGTDYKIAEINHLQWFAGATVQPSFTVMGSSYNENNGTSQYSQPFDIMRKWNVNTSIETFFSYTLKNGSTLNAGPQFRYQLFSSYGNNYNYDEKLYNIGIKLGITRNL